VSGDIDQQVALTIEEARTRAHSLIDESVSRAQELLERSRPSLDAALDRLRGTVDGLVGELRGIHDRLDRIERLLIAAPEEPPASAEPPAEPERVTAPQPTAGGESLHPPVGQPTPPLSLVGTEEESEREVEAEAVPPAVPVPERPASHAAPQPSAPRPAPSPPAPAAPPAEPPLQPEAPADGEPAPQPEAGLIFMPEDGSLIVAVGPVSGFQGLVRVQDALTAHPGVGDVAVEAYSRGEARLRLQLSGPLQAGDLARQLADRLTQSTGVASQSEAERSVRLRLG
jgi:hypothetical protein